MFQPQPSAHGATAQRESGEAYVFRDFERSRIMAIRRAVAADPALYSFWFFAVVAVWTVLMSAGAGMHGQNLPAVNVTPHIAHFTIILGFFFYPLRLIWVPVLAYLVVFLYPFYQPLTNAVAWHNINGMTTGTVLGLFAVNLICGLVVGFLYRSAFLLARPRMRAHAADLFLSFVEVFTQFPWGLGRNKAFRLRDPAVERRDYPSQFVNRSLYEEVHPLLGYLQSPVYDSRRKILS